MCGIVWIYVEVIFVLADERQKIIYEKIKKSGAVTTTNLVEKFGVSVETIRRDLLFMEKQGMLKRVHGGAVEIQGMAKEFELKQRNKEYVEEKIELSKNAAFFVNENDIIFVDAGSTAIHFCESLKENFSNLTVVTYSSDVFNLLCYHKNFKLILCAGHFNKTENAFYGSLVMDAIDGINVQKAFIFPTAVSIEHGICGYNEEFCHLQKMAIKSADMVYILADSGKFEKKALLKIADMKKEYQYITDSDLSSELEKIYAENDINIFKGGAKEK